MSKPKSKPYLADQFFHYQGLQVLNYLNKKMIRTTEINAKDFKDKILHLNLLRDRHFFGSLTSALFREVFLVEM